MKKCPHCGKTFNDRNYCPFDNYPLKTYTAEESKQDQLNKRTMTNTEQPINIPRCPICQSVNIVHISTLKRISHGFAFGLFSKTARSEWECKNCGSKF